RHRRADARQQPLLRDAGRSGRPWVADAPRADRGARRRGGTGDQSAGDATAGAGCRRRARHLPPARRPRLLPRIHPHLRALLVAGRDARRAGLLDGGEGRRGLTRDESLEAVLLVQAVALVVASLLLARLGHAGLAHALPSLKPPVAPGEYVHLLVV